MKHHGFALVGSLLLVLTACGGGGGTEPAPPTPTNPPTSTPAQEPFVSFESAPVRPMALSSDGRRLYAVNTPDGQLEVFDIDAAGQLSHLTSIPVGLDPVAVALRHDGEAWVVNHLSDSVSIVDLTAVVPHVKRTLLVGDEPRDLVFANGRAFVTTAHRGQHRSHASLAGVPGAGDPQIHTPSVPRADVWVFDADSPGDALGGRPEKIVELFGDTPRALAVSPDGNTVYAAVLHSGNQTSVAHEAVVCYGFDDDPLGSQPCAVMDGITSPNGLANGQLPGGRPGPSVNADGVPQPWTGVMVSYDRASGEWRDAKGRNFSNAVRFSLPDHDVFAIDSAALTVRDDYEHVGTTLFNMAVNPVSGRLYVSNQSANNATRFEGPGVFGGSTVQGHIARAQISVIDPASGEVDARHLNRHIDYAQLKASAGVKEHSVATLTEMAVSADGRTLYVAATGSDRIAVYDTAALEDDSLWDDSGAEFDPRSASARHIDVAGGPAGLLLDARHGGRLYVLTRFDNSVAVIDSGDGRERQRLAMYNPEPAAFQAGRHMLYDAERSSSNGEASCASCHVFGDMDHLSWNLGNPDASNGRNPQPFPTEHFSSLGCDLVGPQDESCQLKQIINGSGDLKTFASMKGPMSTQTLRGMSTHGHLHWRGDRSDGYFGYDAAQTLDERTSFKNFIVAFEGLLGLDVPLPASSSAANKPASVTALEADVDKFADFALAVQMPPNPLRGLDNGFSTSAQIGRDFFAGPRRSDGVEHDTAINGPTADGVTCEGCHGHDPAQGFYGSRGEVAHGGEILILKVPQFRNLYQKVGMFGLPDRPGFLPSHTKQHQGDQVRGFGFLHDGATDQLVNFLRGGVFDNGEAGCPPGVSSDHGCEFNFGRIGIPDEQVRQGLVDFLMEFDSDVAPIVGQQITLSSGAGSAVLARVDLLEQRAGTRFVSKVLGGVVTECDLVARGLIGGEARGYLYDPTRDLYFSDRASEPGMGRVALRSLAQRGDNRLSYTCVVPGSGHRIALDRDADGVLNADEIAAGTDPADSTSH